MKRTSTYFPKTGEVPANWRVIDATGLTLGRMARDVAVALQGKELIQHERITTTWPWACAAACAIYLIRLRQSSFAS